MAKKVLVSFVALILLLSSVGVGRGMTAPIGQIQDLDGEYVEAIRRTAEMVWNQQAIALARKYGLEILNVTWEDTGRFKGSCVGPNISDMTLQVQKNRSFLT